MSKLRMAMIGGGGDAALIGPVHRAAIRIDGCIELVGGAFSSDAARSHDTGAALGLAPERVHGRWQELLAAELALPEAERCDIVAIVTPNHLHAEPVCAFLEQGIAVFCEKPLAANVADARAIAEVAARARAPLGMAYTYLGYPLVHEARALVAAGAIGALRRISVSYTQGWLATALEDSGNQQAAWRTDPARSGISGCFLDIGVHAQALSDFITGDPIATLSAQIRAAIAGRPLDDDGAALFVTAGGVPGTLTASQVCAGEENRLEIAIFGESGSIRWRQEEPNHLHLFQQSMGLRTVTTDRNALVSPVASALCRLPAGHPEGLIGAMANLYRGFARLAAPDRFPNAPALDVPGAPEGLRSLLFVDAALRSSRAHSAWTPIAPVLEDAP